MHSQVAVRNFHNFIQAGDSLTNVSGHYISMQDKSCKIIRVAVYLVVLCNIVSNTEVNLCLFNLVPRRMNSLGTRLLSLQLGCNQDNHSMVKTINLFF